MPRSRSSAQRLCPQCWRSSQQQARGELTGLAGLDLLASAELLGHHCAGSRLEHGWIYADHPEMCVQAVHEQWILAVGVSCVGQLLGWQGGRLCQACLGWTAALSWG